MNVNCKYSMILSFYHQEENQKHENEIIFQQTIMFSCENIKIHFLFVCFEKKKSKIKIVYLDRGGKSKNECLFV